MSIEKTWENLLTDPASLEAELQKYTLPNSACSRFPYGMHPCVDAVGESIVSWMRLHQIATSFFDSEAIFQKFLAHQIWYLPARTHPTATVSRMKWIGKLYATACILDDLFDDSPSGQLSSETSIPCFLEFHFIMFWTYPKSTRHLLKKLLDSIDDPALRKSIAELFDSVLAKAVKLPGSEYPGTVSALASGFRDLWCQASGDSPEEWGLCFITDIQNFLLGLMQEAKNRECHSLPSIPNYITMRRNTGAMHMAVGSSTMYVTNCYMPYDLYFSSDVQQLLTDCSDATNWTNDIYSLPKELKKGDFHNLVWLICKEENCSLTEAAQKVADMVEEKCNSVLQIKAKLEKETPPQHRTAMDTMIEKNLFHVRSFLVYHQTSPRYKSVVRARMDQAAENNGHGSNEPLVPDFQGGSYF